MTSTAVGRLGQSPQSGSKAPAVTASTAPGLVRQGLYTLNGIVLQPGDRVLDKDAIPSIDRGVYVVQAGVWRRAKDWNADDDLLSGVLIAAGGVLYQVTFTGPYSVGVTVPVFTDITVAFGAALAAPGGAGLVGASQAIVYTPSTMGAHYNDSPSVKDDPYLVANTGDQASKFTTIRGVNKTFTIPAGAYTLNSAPTAGPAAFMISPGATFNGAGAPNGVPDFTRPDFFPNVGAGATIWRFTDRVLVGRQATGTLTHYQTPDLPNSAAGAGYVLRDATFGAYSTGGLIAVSGFSRASHQVTLPGYPRECIGVSGAIINDNNTQSAWAFYSDIQHEGAGSTSFGIELALKNASGETRKYTSYGIEPGGSLNAGVVGIQAAAGGDNAANRAQRTVTVPAVRPRSILSFGQRKASRLLDRNASAWVDS